MVHSTSPTTIKKNNHLYLRQTKISSTPQNSFYWVVNNLPRENLENEYGLIAHRTFYEDEIESSLIFNHTSGATVSITISKKLHYDEVMVTSANPQTRIEARKSLETLAKDVGFSLVEMSQEELDERGF